MDIGKSSWVLSMKSLWRSLNRVGIWKRIIKDRYMKIQSLVTWIKDGAGVPGAISYIWRRKMKIKQWLLGNLKWHIGPIFGVDTVLDPIYGFVGEHALPFSLIQHLHNLDIYYINQLHQPFYIASYMAWFVGPCLTWYIGYGLGHICVQS